MDSLLAFIVFATTLSLGIAFEDYYTLIFIRAKCVTYLFRKVKIYHS